MESLYIAWIKENIFIVIIKSKYLLNIIKNSYIYIWKVLGIGKCIHFCKGKM